MKNRQSNILAFFLTLTFAEASDGTSVKGKYEVPVKDASLAPFAVYDVAYTAGEAQDYSQEFTFTLPTELTGAPNTITVKKLNLANPKDESFGCDKAKGTCRVYGSDFVCNLKFMNLKFDTAARGEVIRTKFPNTAVADKKFLVAARFSREPQGILRYPFKGK